MPLEEKLRRAAGWTGLLAGALGAFALAGRVAGFDALRFARLNPAPMIANTALALVLAGAALWLLHRGRFPRLGFAVATLLLLLALASAAETIFSINLGIDTMLGRDAFPPRAPLAPGRISVQTSFALAILALALLGLRPGRSRARVPVSSWLAAVVISAAFAALFAVGFGDLGPATLPFVFGLHVSVALLLLGFGVLAARPEDNHVRTLFDPGAAGALARRLFIGTAAVPMLFTGVLIALLRVHVVDLANGVFLLATALVMTGLTVSLFMVETAVGIYARREEAEQARLLLTARLQEQAAQLQETVSQRTRELREANANLLAAAESNALLALVAEHTTSGVVIANAEGRVEWANVALERMTGQTQAELKGRPASEMLRFEGADPAAIARLRAATGNGEPSHIEILNLAKHGRPYWFAVDFQPVRNAAGRITHFIVHFTDITEQRAATQRLHQLNERLALATSAAALGVWEWDAATQRSQWDDRSLEIYGLNRDGFRGTRDDWTQRLHPDDRTRAVAAVQAVISGGANTFDIEFRIVRPDGLVRHVQSNAVVQRDLAGKLLRITGTERDITEERAATLQAEALNERLRLALRSSNYGVWELDLAANRLVWDDRMHELYGLTREQFDGSRDTWLRCVHPADRNVAADFTRRVITGEQAAYDTEFRTVRVDGSIRHIEAHGYLQRDSQGRPLRIVGLNRDITGIKALQDALQLAEQRWQLAIEGTNDSVWDWNIESGQIYHDDRWSRMLGYEAGDLGGTNEAWKQLVHPADLSANEVAVNDHFAQRTPFYQHELRLRTKNGEWKWILDRGKVVSRTPDGRPLRMAGTHTDIDARKHLEERLRKSEELAAQVSSVAQIGGWEYDYPSNTFMWSDGVRRIHEVEDDFVPTLDTARRFYSPETIDLLEAAARSATPSAPNFDIEVPLTTATGRHIWVRVLGHTEFHEGLSMRVHGAIQDVTARHDSDEARRQLESQLFQAQKMETLGTLAGGIAHDFNNLLTGIIGYHELAADSLPEDHPSRACLTEARHASLRARELVEQILTFGRHTPGGTHVPLDMTMVIEEARRFLRSTLPATINIDLRIAPQCPHVAGDATQLHQVILNLGSNAAHAMRHHGGTITILVEPTDLETDQALALGGLPAGRYVRMAVADTGHGMDEATRRRIFDPFFTTKNTREGTGLGLAVVHGIVRAHRGAIDVDSTPNVGSTFHVYLPAVVSESPSREEEFAVVPRGAGEYVYVVDDEEVVGSCTRLVLESKGYRAKVFASAEQCLADLENDVHACSLLVTDQTMPGMQGTDLVATLRRLNPALPVVIMSGYFSKIAPHVLDDLGQVELLAKPFTSDELASSVHRAIHPGTPAS